VFASLRCPIHILTFAGLMFLAPAVTAPTAHRPSPSGARGSTTNSTAFLTRTYSSPLRIPGSTEAWKHLPAAEKGHGQALPVWARTLAKTLPRTTSAMLELDYLHRVRNPIEPILRGQLRWVAAHASGCRYSEAHAAADLRRAGMEETGIRKLAGDLATLPPKTRAALQFAHKLTRDGSSVTDAEVEQLVSLYGERQVVAMVMLLAYANFQDRLILALRLPPEPEEPLPPLDVRFARLPLGANRAGPARQGPANGQLTPAGAGGNQPADAGRSPRFDEDVAGIRDLLAGQRVRRSRIALPAANPEAPRWGLVCRTYQPELTDAWAACTRAFSDEANQDLIFEQNVFWLITHDIRCFY
jgi:alkylhydroperoxidase family enzyme